MRNRRSVNPDCSTKLPLARSREEEERDKEARAYSSCPEPIFPSNLNASVSLFVCFGGGGVRRDRMKIESTPPTSTKAVLLCLEFFDELQAFLICCYV